MAAGSVRALPDKACQGNDVRRKLWSRPVWVDFMAHDDAWRVPLDFPGTLADLKRHQIELAEGMHLVLYTLDATASSDPDDLVTVGTVVNDQGRWFAKYEWRSLTHVSDLEETDRQMYLGARASD